MELTYWMSTFRTMTTESSLLTGFCFAGMRAAEGSTNYVLNGFYLSMTAISMGFGLLCISTATFVSYILDSNLFPVVTHFRNATSFDGRRGLQGDGYRSRSNEAEIVPLFLLLHHPALLLFHICLPLDVD